MIRHIAMLDAKRGIARMGDQPVHLGRDQQYFHDQTISHGGAVLMGRKTWEVIGTLKDRQNYVVTHSADPIEGVTTVSDITEFLNSFEADIWIIGGAAMYEQTLNMADELYLTEIDADLSCDQFYPLYADDFELLQQSAPVTEDGLRYRFCIYRRRS